MSLSFVFSLCLSVSLSVSPSLSLSLSVFHYFITSYVSLLSLFLYLSLSLYLSLCLLSSSLPLSLSRWTIASCIFMQVGCWPDRHISAHLLLEYAFLSDSDQDSFVIASDFSGNECSGCEFMLFNTVRYGSLTYEVIK
jgi:hypothetical protein